MGKDELTLAVLRVLDEHLYGVTYLEVWVVTELRSHYDALALVTDVHDHLSLADGGDGALDNFTLADL